MANAPDYESMSRAELMQLRSEIDRAIAAVGDRDRQRAVKAAEDLAREHGFSLAELVQGGTKGRGGRGKGSRGASGAAPTSSEAKYRNPENAEQTWSGRGRRPQWVHDALANGREMVELEA